MSSSGNRCLLSVYDRSRSQYSPDVAKAIVFGGQNTNLEWGGRAQLPQPTRGYMRVIVCIIQRPA